MDAMSRYQRIDISQTGILQQSRDFLLKFTSKFMKNACEKNIVEILIDDVKI